MFDDWYEWATNATDDLPLDGSDRYTWECVAENAQVEACYADPATCQQFKERLGTDAPKTKQAFRASCKPFQLTGAPITEPLPAYLTRCISLKALEKRIGEVLDEEAGMDLTGFRQQDFEVRLPDIAPDTWKRMSLCVDLPADMATLGLHLTYYRANPVFAGFAEQDDTSPEENHDPGFWDKIRAANRRPTAPGSSNQTFGADEAVYRFALELDRKVTGAWVLLYYERTSLDTFHFPVPPDAGFFPLFRPVTPTDPYHYGRTCPGRPGPCREDLAENEIVHANPRMPLDSVWAISLGETTPG